MVGRFDHPDIAPGCLRQFAVTVFYIPIWFGRFYAVKPGRKGDVTLFAGPFTGAEMVSRYGLGAYWRFKLGVAVVPLIALAVFAALLARSMWMRAHPGG
jgi:hypothetical protein